MPFLLPNQQRQSTEGKKNKTNEKEAWHLEIWHDATKMHDVTIMRWVGETQLVATALPHEYWRLQTHTRNINFILVYFSVILFQRVKTTKQNITNAKRSIYFILDIRVVLTAVFMWISISWFMAEFPSVLDKNLWSHATNNNNDRLTAFDPGQPG